MVRERFQRTHMGFERTLETIVHRCREGQRAAFEELFDIYQPRLKYYVRRLDGCSANVDDVLQDIWLTVFKKIHKLKDTGAFPVWLYRIARNKVYDGFRRKEGLARLPEIDHRSYRGSFRRSDEEVNADDLRVGVGGEYRRPRRAQRI